MDEFSMFLLITLIIAILIELYFELKIVFKKLTKNSILRTGKLAVLTYFLLFNVLIFYYSFSTIPSYLKTGNFTRIGMIILMIILIFQSQMDNCDDAD